MIVTVVENLILIDIDFFYVLRLSYLFNIFDEAF